MAYLTFFLLEIKKINLQQADQMTKLEDQQAKKNIGKLLKDFSDFFFQKIPCFDNDKFDGGVMKVLR